MLPIDLRIVGAGAARPRAGAPTAAAYIASGGSRLLIDCGEGTQVALDRLSISLARLDAVCITHLHGDHLYGLPGLLTSMALEGRTKPLALIGPPDLPQYLAGVFAASSVHDFEFPVQHIATDDAQPRRDVLRLRDLVVHTIPLRHRIRCVGFCVGHPARGRHLRPGVVEAYDIPYREIPALREGQDFIAADGRRIPNNELTTPPDPQRSVAYLTDTAPLDGWPEGWPPPHAVVHDATFAPADAHLADKTGHATVTQAAAFAKTISSERLLLTHLSVRYDDRDTLLAEARAVFAAAEWAEPGGAWVV